MKKIIYLLVLIAFEVGAAQETVTSPQKKEEDTTIYNSSGIEIKPEYPGGMEKFYAFVGKNYKVPNVKNLKGKIIVSFVIEKDGSLTEIKVLRDIGSGTGEEAVRVLKKSKKWSPATQLGVPVRCSYQLPINIEAR